MDDVVYEDIALCAKIVLALWTLVPSELTHPFGRLRATLGGRTFERRRARVAIWIRVYDVSERRAIGVLLIVEHEQKCARLTQEDKA